MKKAILAVVVQLLMLTAAPAANAHVPLPTKHQAYVQAQLELGDWIEYFEQSYNLAYPDGMITEPVEEPTDADGDTSDGEFSVWNVLLNSYTLDPCDMGSRKAFCDFTAWMSDGEGCDGTIEVWETRRGRMQRETIGFSCDGDGWQTEDALGILE
jgi:hypothetical protein